MTPPRVVPFAPHARAPNPRARVAGSTPRPIRVSPTRPRSRVTDARDGERRWNFHSTVRARHRAVSRVALCGRAREGTRLGSTTRLGTDATGTRGITLVAYHRPDRGPTAQCRHRATRPRRDARRANERTRRERRRKPSIRPNPRRAAREETTVERAREEEKGEIFEGWMSC